MANTESRMKDTNKNASWSVFNQVASYSTSLLFTAALARIIAPQDYGIFAMAMTVSAFFLIFADGGMVWSLIQRQKISDAEVINLRWLNGGLGLFMALAALIVSPFVAAFYGYPQVTWVLAVLGVNFFISGISTPSIMWMKRQQRFKAIALIDIGATLLAGGLAIVAALNDFGVWALVIQAVAKFAIQGGLSLFISQCPGGWFQRQVDIKKLTLFGSSLIAFGAVNYFARNLDNVLIGAYIDAEALAYYTRAYFLMTLPSMLTTGALSGLLVSVLSRLQSQPTQLQAQYSHTVRFLYIVCAPIAIYFLLFPQDPIALFYGEQWQAVEPLLQVLSLACLTQPIHNTMGWLFTASGKANNMLKWGIGASTVLSLSFAIGVQWGAVGVAIAYSVIMGIGLTTGAVWYAHISASLSFAFTLKLLLIPLLITALTIAIVFSINAAVGWQFEAVLLSILWHGSLIMLTYIGLIVLFYRGRLRQVLQVAV